MTVFLQSPRINPVSQGYGAPVAEPVNWSACADVYDDLLADNPAYQEILGNFREVIRHWSLPAGSVLADIGAGTGNYSIELARAFPNCTVMHIDNDLYMTSRAKRKARRADVDNWDAVDIAVDQLEIEPGALAAIVSVHALYTFPDPGSTLRRFAEWLAPDGRVFLVDLGRQMNVADWGGFLFGHMCRKRGLVNAMRMIWRNREIARQTRNIARQQRAGAFWTHSHETFVSAVATTGLVVDRSAPCFRGYSDLVVARKPAAA